MFAIGDPEWPGLSKLAEESGELLQVIGKLMGTGGKLDHWDGSNLKERLEEEMADVKAALIFVMRHCKLDGPKMEARAREKLARFERWHELGSTNHDVLP